MARILVVDDNPENLYMLRVLLTGHGCEVGEARNGAEALELARKFRPDLVISDLLMPVMDGYTLLRRWKSETQLSEVPFVVCTATYTDPMDERLAQTLGADAFIIKPVEPEPFMAAIEEILGRRKDGLLSSAKLSVNSEEIQLRQYNETLIRKLEQKVLQLAEANRALEEDVLERKRAEYALGESEERYRQISSSISDFVFSCIQPVGGDCKLDWLAGGVEKITGYTAQEVLDGGSWKFLVHPEDTPIYDKSVAGLEPGEADHCELRILQKDGSIRWIRTASSAVRNHGLPAGRRLFGACEDITRRKKSEEQVRLNEDRLKRIVRILQHHCLTAREFLDYALHEALELTGSKIGYIYFYKEDRRQFILNTWSNGVMDECAITNPETIYELDKTGIWGEAVRQRRPIILNDYQADHPLKKGFPAGHARLHRFMTIPVFRNEAVIAVVGVANKADEYDETDVLQLTLLMDAVWKSVNIREGEEEKEKLESQLRQAQKLESVGRLAGGVAHDYNNVLAVIIGYTEMAMERLEPGDGLHEDLQEVLKAANRSADITRQLLAFARKQTISPVVLDLNDTVESLLKMIRRLMGEDIDLEWFPGGELWRVKMDPSQIDQILANLCVNARDAIAGVGKVTIETDTVALDEAYCFEHAGFAPGEFVLLAVGDDGCGMDRETRENIFEPFFTTKAVDKGTGLGLSTVFGIVKQNNGFINVCSEPGRGTTFKIYLPRHAEESARPPKEEAESFTPKGVETILLVEDEPSILAMTKKMLERSGYTVLPAATPGEALKIAGEHAGQIHLLMTDVVMPEMNGRDLARNILALRPNLKRLFMSGYTANVIAHQGVLDEGVDFIQKPFSMKDLAAKLRHVLGTVIV